MVSLTVTPVLSYYLLPHARAIFISDFLADSAPVEAALTKAGDDFEAAQIAEAVGRYL